MGKIKILLAVLFVFGAFQTGFGQSPGYSIEVKVPHSEGYVYSYASKLCSPNTQIDRKLFSGAISDIDWGMVDMRDYNCKELSNEIKDGFKYGNQIHVYEYIASITITKSDGEVGEIMWIVFPFKQESFVTHVDLSNIEFKAGIYELTDAFDYDTTHHLVMKVKDDYEWVKVNESNLINY